MTETLHGPVVHKLGKLIKQSGYLQDGVDGAGAISVRWQVGMGGVVRGLEKNAFAGLEYSLLRTAVAIVTLDALGRWPMQPEKAVWNSSKGCRACGSYLPLQGEEYVGCI